MKHWLLGSRIRRAFRHLVTAGCLGLVVLISAPVAGAQAAGDPPKVVDPWVRAAPPVVQIHAGYLVIRNPSNHAINLVGVSSPQYKRAEIHLSKVVDGVATMTKQGQVTIPAKGEVAMRPGGFHIMLMHPKAPLKMGDVVDIVLRFSDGSTVAFTAPVKRDGKSKQMPHHGHDKPDQHKMN